MNGENPYEPPRVTTGNHEAPDAIFGEYHLTKRNVSAAESHFLVLSRPGLLLFVSFICIAIAIGLVVVVSRVADRFVGITLVVGMLVSAGIYLLSIYPTRKRVRQAMRAYGLLHAVHYQLVVDQTTTRVTVGSDTWVWQNDRIKVHSFSGGLLLRPETDVFLLLPKHGHFNVANFRELRNVLQTRLTATLPYAHAIRG